MIFVFNQRNGGVAHLLQVERADVARHAHRDAHVAVDQNGRKGHRQQRRLLHRRVVVIHKVHGILVDVAEQLARDRIQLRLGITRGGIFHIRRIRPTKVTLGIHIRMQQRLIAPRQAHHGFVDRRVTVRVQLHGRADNVGGFGARTGQQPLLVHGVQQLAVGRLKPINFRNSTRHDHTHRIRHIVGFQRIGDGLVFHRSRANDMRVFRQLVHRRCFFHFFCHGRHLLSLHPPFPNTGCPCPQ